MTLPIIILLPLLVGTPLASLADRLAGRSAAAWTVAAVTATSLVLLLLHLPDVMTGQPVIVGWEWLPAIGLNLSFRLDGLGMMFGLLILGIGLLIILYASYYLSPSDPAGKFYSMLMLFMAAMLGIVLSENLLLLAIFWELTSLSSFLLIGYWNHQSAARRGARMALAVTGGGGLAMLAGVLLIGSIVGSFELSAVFAARDILQAHTLYPVALGLVLLGAFTKSAQFPFHFWLPEAMSAPTPVSAYLHSATMVKAGVFLLARMHPAFGGSLEYTLVVSTVGLTTMVFAAYVAIFKHDLKGLLAYSTISHLGLITFLLGLDTPLSSVAAVFHIINHATFKASLFMTAGIIDHECGTRDMRRLGGLWKYMPHTATLAMVAAAAMAGVPLLNGFLSKEMFFAESLELGHLGLLGQIAPVAVTLGGAFSVAYSLRFIHNVFFNGEPRGLDRKPHEPPRFMKVPVEILVVICIVVGILPGITVAPILAVAARDVLGGALPAYSISIWHGFNLPLLMSGIAVAGGCLMYWLLQRHHLQASQSGGLDLPRLFHHSCDRLASGARQLTGLLVNGSLQRYLMLLVATVVLLGVSAFLEHGYSTGQAALTPPAPLAIVVWVVAVVAAMATTVLHQQRFAAVILVGVVGLATALTFAYFSAPDLALTQLSVEIAATVLMLVALALMPQRERSDSPPERRTRDALLAVGAGAGVTALMWAVLTRPHESIAWFFLRESVPGGGGSNVVNVILVDFRGFDTFGEIIVLGIAGVGVLLLMDGLRDTAAEAREKPAPLMLSVAARALLPFALLVSAYIFLRGHNLPGGGFIAGLVTAVALAIQYVADGIAQTRRRLGDSGTVMVGAGLLIAGLTGAASAIFGAPFLTSTYGHPVLPLLGEVPIASALAFDLGVYLTVVGASLMALTRIGFVPPAQPATAEGRA